MTREYTFKNKKTGEFVKFNSDHVPTKAEIRKAVADKKKRLSEAHEKKLNEIQSETSNQISSDFHKEHPILAKMLDMTTGISPESISGLEDIDTAGEHVANVVPGMAKFAGNMLSSMTLDPLTMQPSGMRRAAAAQPEEWQGQARADIPFVDPIVKLLDPELSEQEKSGAAGDIIGQGALFGGLGKMGAPEAKMPTVAPDLPTEEFNQPQLGTG